MFIRDPEATEHRFLPLLELLDRLAQLDFEAIYFGKAGDTGRIVGFYRFWPDGRMAWGIITGDVKESELTAETGDALLGALVGRYAIVGKDITMETYEFTSGGFSWNMFVTKGKIVEDGILITEKKERGWNKITFRAKSLQKMKKVGEMYSHPTW